MILWATNGPMTVHARPTMTPLRLAWVRNRDLIDVLVALHKPRPSIRHAALGQKVGWVDVEPVNRHAHGDPAIGRIKPPVFKPGIGQVIASRALLCPRVAAG